MFEYISFSFSGLWFSLGFLLLLAVPEAEALLAVLEAEALLAVLEAEALLAVPEALLHLLFVPDIF
jgi:hypothetical protein